MSERPAPADPLVRALARLVQERHDRELAKAERRATIVQYNRKGPRTKTTEAA